MVHSTDWSCCRKAASFWADWAFFARSYLARASLTCASAARSWASAACSSSRAFFCWSSAAGSGGTAVTPTPAIPAASSTAATICRWVRNMVCPLSKIEPELRCCEQRRVPCLRVLRRHARGREDRAIRGCSVDVSPRLTRGRYRSRTLKLTSGGAEELGTLLRRHAPPSGAAPSSACLCSVLTRTQSDSERQS